MEISEQLLDWLLARDYTDIYGHQQINPDHFGDGMTFLELPALQGFFLPWKMSQHLLD